MCFHLHMPLKSNGPELRRRRQLLAMTATEFARKADYTLAHVSQVELGKSNAGPHYLRKAATIFGCDVEDLVQPKQSAA